MVALTLMARKLLRLRYRIGTDDRDDSDLRQQKRLLLSAVSIGIHSGPIVAGVIGKKKFAFELFGNTINMANRMQSHNVPGQNPDHPRHLRIDQRQIPLRASRRSRRQRQSRNGDLVFGGRKKHLTRKSTKDTKKKITIFRARRGHYF